MSETPSAQPRHQYEAFLRQLPADWEQKEITQVGAVVGGGTPSRAVPSFWRGSIPWVTPGEVSGEAAKLLNDTNDHISASGLAGSGANLLPAGSLLVTTRATLGARVINAVPMATNQGFKSIVFKKPEEASYYYHLFEKVKPELVRRASGTTFLEISGAEFGSIKVPSPSPAEKLNIAKILDALDTAIHQTEAIVKKLKQVKQGLLYDLLTRGVGANSELRPSYEDAPHLYQESLAGWIPKEWEATQLGAVTSWASGGTPSRAIPSNWTGPIPLLTPKDMKSFEMSDTSEHLSLTAAKVGSRVMPAETVFIVVRGMILAHSFPVVLASKPMAFNQDVKAVTAGQRLSGRFLAHWFVANSGYFLRKVTEATHGTKKLDMENLLGTPIGLPPLTEQIAIIERESAIDRQCKDESSYLLQLLALKAGLTDDLLTGRVRVTSLLAQ